jgi:hypothetical protein
MAQPKEKKADIGQLVRPEDFRRSLQKVIAMRPEEFVAASTFTRKYSDSLIEAGYRAGTNERDAIECVLVAFSHAMFERVY